MDSNLFTRQGKFLMLALDHRNSLRRLLDSGNPAGVGSEQLTDFKRGVIEALKDQFSGLLLDPEYGLPAYREVFESAKERSRRGKESDSLRRKESDSEESAARSSGSRELPKSFLLSIEKSGYREENGGRVTELEYTVEELKSLGAAGVKLLLYFNPHSPTAEQQIELGGRVLEDCQKYDLPLFLEIVTYNTERVQPASGGLNPIGGLKMLLAAGIRPAVFKLEYPGDADSCRRITELLGETPWVLLSRGKDFEVFKEELKVAVANGAAGFLAGRTLWQEVTTLRGTDRECFLTQTLPIRFRELVDMAP